MKNKDFKIPLLLFGAMSGLSIILCLVSGNKAPFIQFISSVILILSPPILYLAGIFKLINSMIEKKTNVIASIIACVLATIIFLSFYVLACIAILIG